MLTWIWYLLALIGSMHSWFKAFLLMVQIGWLCYIGFQFGFGRIIGLELRNYAWRCRLWTSLTITRKRRLTILALLRIKLAPILDLVVLKLIVLEHKCFSIYILFNRALVILTWFISALSVSLTSWSYFLLLHQVFGLQWSCIVCSFLPMRLNLWPLCIFWI